MTQKRMPRASSQAARPSAARLRVVIARELVIARDDLREWSTERCPECHRDCRRKSVCAVSGLRHLPPIYYVMAPERPDGDMPLGIGASAAEALADLLWSVRAERLLEDLSLEESGS